MLWRDEAFTAVVAHRPLDDMLSAISHDSAPPLHYVLEWLLVHADVVPRHGLAPRLDVRDHGRPRVESSLLAAVGRRIAGERAALWTALVVAVLPATVAASRDARPYALAGCLVVAATVLLWRALERPSTARWLAMR